MGNDHPYNVEGIGTICVKMFDGIVVDCLKITEDKSLKSRIQTPDARLVIATSAALRREG